jgi:hypothetical protein
MLFLCYWELNENMSSAERTGIANKLMSAGLFPPPGVRILRWDETPDAWGILLFEAESALQAAAALLMWRASGAGFFRLTRTAPAFPINEETVKALEEVERAAAQA